MRGQHNVQESRALNALHQARDALIERAKIVGDPFHTEDTRGAMSQEAIAANAEALQAVEQALDKVRVLPRE